MPELKTNKPPTDDDILTPQQMGISVIGKTASALKNTTDNIGQSVKDTVNAPVKNVQDLDILTPKQMGIALVGRVENEAQKDMTLPALANTAGNLAGDYLAGPEAGPVAGALARMGLGTAANYLTNLVANPETRQHPISEFFNSLFSNAGQEAIGQGAGVVGDLAKRTLLNRLAPNVLSPEEQALIRSTPDNVPLTVGNVTGSQRATSIADRLAPGKVRKTLQAQQEYGQTAGSSGPGTTSYDPQGAVPIVQDAMQKAQANEQQMAASVKQASADFDKTVNTQKPTIFRKVITDMSDYDKMAQENPDKLKALETLGMAPSKVPPSRLDPIYSPIELKASRPVANQAQAMIRQMLPNASVVEGPLRPVYDSLSQISQELQGVTENGKFTSPAIEFRRLDALHDAISKGLGDIGTLTNDSRPSFQNINGMLRQLDTAIQADMDQSIQKWGPKAYSQYQAMQKAKIDKLNTFDPESAQNLLLGGRSVDGAYNDIADKALSSADSVKKWVAATGDRDSIAKLAVQRLQDNAYDAASGKINFNKILGELNSPDRSGVYAEAIPSTERSNLQEFYKRMSLLPETNPMSGGTNSFLLWHGTHIGMAFALGSMTHAGAGVAGLTAVYGIEKYLGDLMSNPQVARALINGTRIPAASGASNVLGKVVLNSLKGLGGLYIQDQNIPGKMIPAHINQQGQPVPDAQ